MVAMTDAAWVLGYLSAYNAFVAGDGDISGTADANAVLGWMDNHCGAHPLETIEEATQALIKDLVARKR
jgi:hypothetical protein